MSARLPAAWERELERQRKLRQKLARFEKVHRAALDARDQVTKQGGPHWVTRLGQLNLLVDRAWQQVRRTMQHLFDRTTPV